MNRYYVYVLDAALRTHGIAATLHRNSVGTRRTRNRVLPTVDEHHRNPHADDLQTVVGCVTDFKRTIDCSQAHRWQISRPGSSSQEQCFRRYWSDPIGRKNYNPDRFWSKTRFDGSATVGYGQNVERSIRIIIIIVWVGFIKPGYSPILVPFIKTAQNVRTSTLSLHGMFSNARLLVLERQRGATAFSLRFSTLRTVFVWCAPCMLMAW